MCHGPAETTGENKQPGGSFPRSTHSHSHALPRLSPPHPDTASSSATAPEEGIPGSTVSCSRGEAVKCAPVQREGPSRGEMSCPLQRSELTPDGPKNKCDPSPGPAVAKNRDCNKLLPGVWSAFQQLHLYLRVTQSTGNSDIQHKVTKELTGLLQTFTKTWKARGRFGIGIEIHLSPSPCCRMFWSVTGANISAAPKAQHCRAHCCSCH